MPAGSRQPRRHERQSAAFTDRETAAGHLGYSAAISSDQEAALNVPVSCDHCGVACDGAELQPLHRIEEVVIDLASGLEAGPPTGRGRVPWFPLRARDPAVLVSTPRYRYVKVSYKVCADCLQRAEADERGLRQFHRRATLVVALVAGGLGVAMLSVWVFWLGVYADLVRSDPAQAFAGAPPPTTQPYKPPFSAATPTAP
jgi:hypothetical protein